MNIKQLIPNKLQVVLSTNDPKLFFALLRELAQLILKDPELQESLAIINHKQKKMRALLEALEEEGFNELKIRAEEIRNYITNNRITDNTKELVVWLLDIFQERIASAKRLSRALLLPLDQALYTLLYDEYLDNNLFEKTFGKINRIGDEKFVNIDDFFPKFNVWEKETSYFIQAMQTADWFSLNQIAVFVERYDLRHYDTLLDELAKNGVDTIKLQEEHHALISRTYFNATNSSSNMFPTIEEYKYHIRNLVVAINQARVICLYHADIQYDSDTGILSINDKQITFDPKNIEGRILFALTPGGKPCKQPMWLDEIGVEVFDKESLEKNNKDSIYKGSSRINLKIAAQTLVEETLSSDGKGKMFWNLVCSCNS